MNNIPHQVVINVKVEGTIFEKNNLGECAKSVHTKRYSHNITFNGDIDECSKQLDEFMTKLSAKLILYNIKENT